MQERLVVLVVGSRNSGKSTTWNRLFGAEAVRTGKYLRSLYLNRAQYVDVFLVAASAEEREKEIKTILPQELPQIVLCSAQYREDVTDTFNFFLANRYDMYVQWLNPGYGDLARYADNLDLRQFLLTNGATLQERDGRVDPTHRVRELRHLILGWATYIGLVKTEFPE